MLSAQFLFGSRDAVWYGFRICDSDSACKEGLLSILSLQKYDGKNFVNFLNFYGIPSADGFRKLFDLECILCFGGLLQ